MKPWLTPLAQLAVVTLVAVSTVEIWHGYWIWRQYKDEMREAC